jgi:hypothetical protein
MMEIYLGQFTSEYARPYKVISAVLARVNRYLTMPLFNIFLVYSSGYGCWGVRSPLLRRLGVRSLPSVKFSINGSWNPFRRGAFSRGAGYRGGWTLSIGINIKTQPGGCGAYNIPFYFSPWHGASNKYYPWW